MKDSEISSQTGKNRIIQVSKYVGSEQAKEIIQRFQNAHLKSKSATSSGSGDSSNCASQGNSKSD